MTNQSTNHCLDHADQKAKTTTSQQPFIALLTQEVARKRALGKHGTGRAYHNAATSITRFLEASNQSQLLPPQIDSSLIETYQTWLVGRGLCHNSTSCYMRCLRCCYNNMVRAGLCCDQKPFANVYTGIAKTRKRAISEADMHKIKDVDLSQHPALARVRDLFMLSFYLMGISFVDLCFLKKSNVRGHELAYQRAKTGQPMRLTICRKAAEILRRHASDDAIYLLPIVSSDGDQQRQYQSALRTANAKLKQIARLAGVTANITTYTPRHSWASIAKAKNIKLGIISDALGHQSEATTRIYLATLDNGATARANAVVTRNL